MAEVPPPLRPTVVPGLSFDEIEDRRARLAKELSHVEEEIDVNMREYHRLLARRQEIESEDSGLYRRQLRMVGRADEIEVDP